MSALPRAIQGLILFSTALGVLFLWQAYPLVPPDVFYVLFSGWGLFVVDSVLTFVRPKLSYYMGAVLAAVALAETLSQPEHYALVENGNILATATLILGSVTQGLLIILIGYFLLSAREQDPWAWPAEESEQAA